MIELNLLPEALKLKQKEIKFPPFPIFPAAVGAFSVLIAIHLVFLGLLQVNKSRLNVYNKKWEELAPTRKKFMSLQAEVDGLDAKVKLLQSLMQNRVFWARKLNAISEAVPANMWLERLAYSKGLLLKAQEKVAAAPAMGNLYLKGVATGKPEEATANIGRFIKALQDDRMFSDDFSEVELGSIKRNLIDTTEVMDFNLICNPKAASKK